MFGNYEPAMRPDGAPGGRGSGSRLVAIAARLIPLRRAWSRWGGARPRQRLAVAAICALLAALGLAGILGSNGDQRDPATPADPVGIHVAKEPHVVRVSAGSVKQVALGTPQERRELADSVAMQTLPVVHGHPRRLIALSLPDLPFSFEALSSTQKAQLGRRLGPDAAEVYEQAVAEVLEATIAAVAATRPAAHVSVVGLPVEPGVGIDVRSARRTNARYRPVIDRLDPFVPARSLLLLGTSLDESVLAEAGMPEAIRLREGRSVVFRTNVVWRVLVDADDLQDQQYLVADTSGDTGRGPRGLDRRIRDVLLGDDPFEDP